MIKIAINGFGRIGRAAFKVALKRTDLEVVAINDLTDTTVLAHLLKYDSAYGGFDGTVSAEADGLIVNGKKYKVTAEKEPASLPWGEMQVDVVLECTGRFVKDDAANAHLQAGAKRVVVSAPTKGGDTQTFLLGVNSDMYRGQAMVSNASCTTNCVGPVTSVIDNAFGIAKAALTTVHSYTAEQNLVDGPPPGLKGDLRRARASAQNIVPTSTGAAISTTEVLPQLKGVFDGLALRVPTIVGSLSDFTFLLKRNTTAEEVNHVFERAASEAVYKGILAVTKDEIVSTDIIGNSHSAIVDLSLTKVIDGNLLKVIAWYDNEWGYANRLVEMAVHVGKNL